MVKYALIKALHSQDEGDNLYLDLQPRTRMIAYNRETLQVRCDVSKPYNPRVFVVERVEDSMIKLFEHDKPKFDRYGVACVPRREWFWHNHKLVKLEDWYRYCC